MGELNSERFRQFVSKCGADSHPIAVVYHPDADGFTSAFIVSKAIERLRGKKPELIFCQERSHVEITEKTVKKLKKAKVGCIITVDLCVDQEPKNVKKVEKFAFLLVIDHHKMYKDLNSKKTFFIKAGKVSKIDGSRYPASKLSYDLFSQIVNLSDISWVSAVGIMGDNALRQWESFVEKSARDAGVSIETLIKVKRVIDGVEALNGKGFKALMKEFEKAKTPKDILKAKISKYSKLLQEKLDGLIEKAEKNAEFYPEIELMLFEFSGKFNIKSALINELSRRCKNMTIIVIEDLGKETLGISARRQDFKVKMNELLEKATKGMKGSNGGGHIPAAGGRIRRKDFWKFKGRVISILGKKYGKKVIS